jgi:hypothetical protein
MKIAALILFLFVSSGSFAQGSTQPSSGSDSYGQGLSYPDNSGPFYIASFLALNNTNGTSPFYLGTNVFRPNESLIKSLNRTDYYQIIRPLWDQFDFYLPIPSIYEWFSKDNDNPPPAARKITGDDWKPGSEDVATPTMKQFVEKDVFEAGVEPHNDPDRMELNNFLESDEPPGSPLL